MIGDTGIASRRNADREGHQFLGLVVECTAFGRDGCQIAKRPHRLGSLLTKGLGAFVDFLSEFHVILAHADRLPCFLRHG